MCGYCGVAFDFCECGWPYCPSCGRCGCDLFCSLHQGQREDVSRHVHMRVRDREPFLDHAKRVHLSEDTYAD